MKFSNYIKDLRKSLNMTQLDVSDKIGLSRSYLAKIESGKIAPPSDDIIEKISNALRCSYDELLKLAVDDRENFENQKTLINNYMESRFRYNPSHRYKCLETYGYSCYICGFNFLDTYGDLQKNLMEVHHISPKTYNNVNDNIDENMIPICCNCHKAIHALNITPEKLKDRVYKVRREKLYSSEVQCNIDDYNIIGDKLCIAATDGNLNLFKKLIGKIMNYNLKYKNYSSLIDAALEASIKNNHLHIIDYILNLPNLDFNNMKYSFIASCDDNNYHGLHVFKNILSSDINISKVLFYFRSSSKYIISDKNSITTLINLPSYYSYSYYVALSEDYFKVLFKLYQNSKEYKIHIFLDYINFLPKDIAKDIFKYNTYTILSEDCNYAKGLSLLVDEVIDSSNISYM